MKKIAIAAACLLALEIKAQVATWVPGVVSGMATAIGVVVNAVGDYEGYVISSAMESYNYECTTKYLAPKYVTPVTYVAKWKVFKTWNGVFQYSYILTANGSPVGQPDYTAFDIGPNEQPLCKRDWKCTLLDANTGWPVVDSFSKADMSMKVQHTVLKWPKAGWMIPSSIEVKIMACGEQLAAVCGTANGPVTCAVDTVAVPHGAYVMWSNFPRNINVASIYGMVKR